ncbi:uncharacterized protein SCHCODRAFT_02753959 [Schizophyllum commune H4-8]|uniref:uncharacterized protein n=1 Tax=Schizophyllum commune (strain H4-8 / FGSC 9210) TaxID=578458 RepID=UPI00215EF157|nr:uncharacterized protein SCHCODRAFT_02753959 [Schizophyllum commune H4-8]KAI5884896.1 hypothetical protein SCHCODRAFT_02753959 [Schizophyllum commune H4-8]
MNIAVNAAMNVPDTVPPASGPSYVARPPPGMSTHLPNAPPPCRPCTQCTYLIPAADPYRMCKVCRKEARERARKRRIKVLRANPDFPGDANQEGAIHQHEHTLLPRGEYRQIESDQNVDPNVGRKRMRLTEGFTSLQGISYADVLGTAQEQKTSPDIFNTAQEHTGSGQELQSNVAPTYLTRDLTNYTKAAGTNPTIPLRSNDTSSLDDPAMYLGSLLGQTAIHYKSTDRSKTPPRSSQPVIDLCSPEMPIAAASAPYQSIPSPAQYSPTSHATQVSKAQPPIINTAPPIDNAQLLTPLAQPHPSYAQSLALDTQLPSLNFHTSANFAPPVPEPTKKKRKPRIYRPRADAAALQQSAPSRQQSVPLSASRTLVPCEPSRPPPVPARRAVSGPVPRMSAKSTSRRSAVASTPRAIPSAPAQSRYPWPYCYYAPNYGQALTSTPPATQNSAAHPSGPTTSFAPTPSTSAAPKPAAASSTPSDNGQASAAPLVSPALSSATISTSNTASPSLYVKTGKTSSHPAQSKSPQTPATTPTADCPEMDIFGHLQGAALDEQLMRDLCALVDGPSPDTSIQHSDDASATQIVPSSVMEGILPVTSAATPGRDGSDPAGDLAWLDAASGDMDSVFDFDVERAIPGWEGQDGLSLESLSWDTTPWTETQSQLDDMFGESQSSSFQNEAVSEPAQITSDEWASLFEAHDHDGGFALGVESISAAPVDEANFGSLDGMAATGIEHDGAWAEIFGMQ